MKDKEFVEETLDFSKKLNLDLLKESHVFEQVSSTNKKAKELAKKNVPDGTIIISKTQDNGRGRFNRVWISPEGGVYFSIILKPKNKDEKLTLLPLVAALSVYNTIYSLCDLDVKIKWPNDVIINGKKISGILIESESKNNSLDFVVIGIGFNLNVDVDIFPEEYNATSLSYEIGINLDYYDFLKKLLFTLDKYYSLFINEDYDTILNEWRKNSDTIGKNVVINLKDKKISGRAVDIDENGFLIILDEYGNKTKITSGDCFYIK